MAQQFAASHHAEGRAEFATIPGAPLPDHALCSLTSLIAQLVEHRGADCTEQRAGFLRVRFRGRTIGISLDLLDPPPSDQFPAIPADDRLRIARCADCDGEGARFTEGEDGEVSYRLDFRRMDGAIGD